MKTKSDIAKAGKGEEESGSPEDTIFGDWEVLQKVFNDYLFPLKLKKINKL